MEVGERARVGHKTPSRKIYHRHGLTYCSYDVDITCVITRRRPLKV